MDTVAYIKAFLKDINVASVMPTSVIAVRRICKAIEFSRDIVIVEYGPGTGVFTEYLLDNISLRSRLVLIESNREFVSILKEKFVSPRVEVFHESAKNVLDVLDASGLDSADYIISGIPFSFFNDSLKNQILGCTKAALKKGGMFLVYQHYNHLKELLTDYFDEVEVRPEILNIPPLKVFKVTNHIPDSEVRTPSRAPR